MTIFHWILLPAFAICFLSCLFQFFKILFSNKFKNQTAPRDKIGSAIVYAFTIAMLPRKKETALFHLPTYVAGILFHLGTFWSFFWLVVHFFHVNLPDWIVIASILFLSISLSCGIAMFIKRLVNPNMRKLSNPDDYVSNLLVTGFQIVSVLTLIWNTCSPYLFIYAAILFFYIPISKLRHVVYFFTSRLHLAMFYGKRGVWQLKRQKI